MPSLSFIVSTKVQKFIIFVIIVNAITLGLMTSHKLMALCGGLLNFLDNLALAIFTVELLVKIAYQRLGFFKDPWNIFDFLIVGISYVPATAGLKVMRALRILRIFRLISSMPRLRMIVQSLITSLPSIGWIVLLLFLVFYVFAVMATTLFGSSFPEWFGSLSESFFTLFQIMTLESWAMGVARPVMEVYPYAFLFFIPFVMLSTFVILNVFVAIVVNGMSETRDSENQTEAKAHSQNEDLEELKGEVKALRAQIQELTALMKAQDKH